MRELFIGLIGRNRGVDLLILLASASPRRKELMELLGEPFCVKAPNVDETLPDGIAPAEAVAHLSKLKADAMAGMAETIIAADTVVAIDGCILGKPKNENSAAEMLRLLSGRIHSVFTGVTVTHFDKIYTFTEETKVEFYPLSEQEIWDYIATGEPADKAGAYGIQGKGSLLVRRMEGDYFNVVGLPVSRLSRVLKEMR